jgi:hypothetical protein
MANEKRIMELESEELLDRFSDDPKGVLTGLANEIRADLRSEMEREAAETKVANTYQRFKDQYPDFEGKWRSGEIKSYMDAHPGHNALSAYYMIRKDQQPTHSGGDERLNDSRQHGGKHAVLAQRLHDRRAGGSGDNSPPETPGDLIPTV